MDLDHTLVALRYTSLSFIEFCVQLRLILIYIVGEIETGQYSRFRYYCGEGQWSGADFYEPGWLWFESSSLQPQVVGHQH